MRIAAADAIGELRPSDEAVVEALNDHVNDTKPALREAAAAALEKFKKK